MRRERFTEERIVRIPAAGMKTDENCRRRHGICHSTFYRWKAKDADMEISGVSKHEGLENEKASEADRGRTGPHIRNV